MNNIPLPIAIIIAGALIAAGIVVEPFVTDRGRFVPSSRGGPTVYDTRTGCVYYDGRLMHCPSSPRR
jgi:hypothetical protein